MARRRSRRLVKPLVPGFWTLLVVAMLLVGTLGMMWLGGKVIVARPDSVRKAVK
jgi:predicted DNA repair protein MutK